jgi:DNA-3-methyladenine glycosylase
LPKSVRLTRRFFRRDPVTLAQALLGQVLVRRLPDGQELSGKIVEVEAYLGIEDRAAHTFGGRRTPRNASMWGDAGRAYVYFTYGMHWCLNVVSDREKC